MPIQVNQLRGRDASGKLSYTRPNEPGYSAARAYVPREGGGYTETTVDRNNAPARTVVAIGNSGLGVSQSYQQPSTPTQAPGYKTPSIQDQAASNPDFVASSRRGAGEYILSNGERASPNASYNAPLTSSNPGFQYTKQNAPSSRADPVYARNQLISATARNDRFLGGVVGYAQVREDLPIIQGLSTASGKAADFFQNVANSPTANPVQKWGATVGEGYFRTRQKYPEAYAADLTAPAIGYGAGTLLGGAANAGVNAFARAAPIATTRALPYIEGAGSAAMLGAAGFAAYGAATNPREFGSTGLTSLALFGGAGAGFTSTYGIRTTSTLRAGRPRAEIRYNAYGYNTATITASRDVSQAFSVYGKPYTARGVEGVSGLLRATESGGYAGELTATRVLRGPRGVTTTQDSFNVALRGRDIGALRRSDSALFGIPTSSTRTLAPESSAYLDPVQAQRGRIALLDASGRVRTSRPLRSVNSAFDYRGPVTGGVRNLRLEGEDLGITIARFNQDLTPRTYGESVSLTPATSRPRAGYGQRSLQLLREQNYLETPPKTTAYRGLGRRGSLGEGLARTDTLAPENVARTRGTRAETLTNLAYLRAGETTRSLELPLAFALTPGLRSNPSTRQDNALALRTTPSLRSTQRLDLAQNLGLGQTQELTQTQRLRPIQTQRLTQQTDQLTNRNFFTPPVTTPLPPTLPLPFLPPIGATSAGRYEAPSRGATRGFSYAPSLNALLGNIKGRKQPGNLLGFETRPIILTPKRRR